MALTVFHLAMRAAMVPQTVAMGFLALKTHAKEL
jgi:hypothetical protein